MSVLNINYEKIRGKHEHYNLFCNSKLIKWLINQKMSNRTQFGIVFRLQCFMVAYSI